MPTVPSLREMLENGVHFGHVTSRWNPKMKPYIFMTRDKIHVINLEHTRAKLEDALQFLQRTVEKGGLVLFVGTKSQARDLVKQAATESGMPYITERWFGGTLTNFDILRKNVKALDEIEEREAKGEFDHLTKKERLRIEERKTKLFKLLEGVRHMGRLPGALLVVDGVHESIAIREARNLHIPVVALIDTNADPSHVDYPIPANDDASKSLTLLLGAIRDVLKSARATAAAVPVPEKTADAPEAIQK